jgi:CRISPR system Cascade subunit CasE
MSPLYLTRARLRIEDSRIAAILPLLVKHQNARAASHHRVWSLMSDDPGRTRDFLFRDVGEITFVLSGRVPVDSPLWEHETRVVPVFGKGDVLQFTLRASPVVRRSREGRRSAKRDPILERLGKLPASERSARRRVIAQEETSRWLGSMGEGCGYQLKEALIEDHDQVAVQRRGEPPILFSVVNVTGVLSITDPAAFAARLGQGFGPAKAWGCGLMLCKRIDR